jgi:hypothetical protein
MSIATNTSVQICCGSPFGAVIKKGEAVERYNGTNLLPAGQFFALVEAVSTRYGSGQTIRLKTKCYPSINVYLIFMENNVSIL